MESKSNSFVREFLSELSTLEDEFSEFAREYPQVAGKVGINSEGSSDPHVRQIIESVAFISARLKRHMDGIPEELAYSLVRALAPHQCLPLPCMAVLKLEPISNQLPVVGTAPSDTARFQVNEKGEECVFEARSADIKIWPLKVLVKNTVINEKIIKADKNLDNFVIEISRNENLIPKDSPGELTFFIDGAVRRALSAIDAIGNGVVGVTMVALDQTWATQLSKNDIKVLGFDERHRMMPEQHRSKNGDSAIQEYLGFPRRFCFFKISNLKPPKTCAGFYIVLQVKASYIGSLKSVKDNININCIPVINIFKPPIVLIPLDSLNHEYAIPKFKPNLKYWDTIAINSVKLLSNEHEISLCELKLGIAEAEHAIPQVVWEQVRLDRPTSNIAKSALGLRIIGMNTALVKESNYKSAVLDTYACNTQAPEMLMVGQGVQIVGWESGYKAVLMSPASQYVGHRSVFPSRTMELIRSMQLQSGYLGDVKQALENYIGSLDRVRSAHSLAFQKTLLKITKEVIAIPYPKAPLGAMLGMGLRYRLEFVPDGGYGKGNFLNSKIIALALEQVHGEVLPVEIQTVCLDREILSVN